MCLKVFRTLNNYNVRMVDKRMLPHLCKAEALKIAAEMPDSFIYMLWNLRSCLGK